MSFRHHYYPLTIYGMLREIRAKRKIEEDNFMEPSERGWKLCREKVPGWQEYYMERLIEDYVAYLNSNEPASIKFRTMEKRMRQDKKAPGVRIELSKGNVISDLVRFLRDEIIVFDNSDEFSEELRENIRLLKEGFG